MTILCNLVMLAFTTKFTFEFWMLMAIAMGLVEQNKNLFVDCADIEGGLDG